MKTERTQYPLLGMAGFLLVAGNAMWAAFLVCGWSIGLSGSQTEGIMEELRLPVILAAMGLIMLLTALGMSLYKDWKYRRRIEVPLVFSRFCGAAGTRGTADRRRSHGESCWGSTVCSRCPARYCRVPRFPGGPIIIRRSWTCSRRSPCPSRPPLLSVGRIPEITSLSPCGRQPTEKETDGTVFGGRRGSPAAARLFF